MSELLEKKQNLLQEQIEEPTFEEILTKKSLERLKPGQSQRYRITTYTFQEGDRSL